MSQDTLFPVVTPPTAMVGIINEIHSQCRNNKEWPPVYLPGVWIVIQKLGTKTKGPGRTERHWIPGEPPNEQRSLVFDAHLNRWPVYVQDGVLRRAEQ